MKKNLLPTKKKLAAYSAFATAFIANAASADAQVVYIDIPDFTVDLGSIATMDVDGDGTDDFMFAALSASSAAWTYANVFGSFSLFSVGGPNNAIEGYAGALLPYGSALDSGLAVGSTGNFLTTVAYNRGWLASIYSGITYGAWADVTDKFLGFRFDIGGATHYGWVRLDVTVGPVSITIKDWAYNATPDAPVATGDMGIGEFDFPITASTVSEGVGTVDIGFTLSDPGDCTVDVDINGALTTALEGGDFNFADPSPIVFTDGGPTTGSFSVNIFDDLDFEIPETITFNLTNVTGGCVLGADTIYTLTINDNDAPPAINFVSAGDATPENSGVYPVTVTVSDPADCTVEMTLNGALTTATEGTDFSYTVPSPIVFTAAGPTTQTFNINLIDDAIIEPTESIVFDLTSVTGCILGVPTETTIDIVDNDTPDTANVQFSVAAVSTDENGAAYIGTVSLSTHADCSVEIQLNTAASTATEGTDFTFSSPLVMTFTEGGATSADFTVPIINDLAVEGDETISLQLAAATGACEIGAGTDVQTITITDDDQVGIQDPAADGISIFAFNNNITIQLSNVPDASAFMEITDASGKRVYRSEMNAAEQLFDVRSLPAGMYIVRLTDHGKNYQKKIILTGK